MGYKAKDTSLDLLNSEVIDNLVTMTELGVVRWATPKINNGMAVRCSKETSDYRTVIGHLKAQIGFFEVNLYATQTAYKLNIYSSSSGRYIDVVKSPTSRFVDIYEQATSKAKRSSCHNHQYLMSQTEDMLKEVFK